jgi:hypothetical protein
LVYSETEALSPDLSVSKATVSRFAEKTLSVVSSSLFVAVHDVENLRDDKLDLRQEDEEQADEHPVVDCL